MTSRRKYAVTRGFLLKTEGSLQPPLVASLQNDLIVELIKFKKEQNLSYADLHQWLVTLNSGLDVLPVKVLGQKINALMREHEHHRKARSKRPDELTRFMNSVFWPKTTPAPSLCAASPSSALLVTSSKAPLSSPLSTPASSPVLVTESETSSLEALLLSPGLSRSASTSKDSHRPPVCSSMPDHFMQMPSNFKRDLNIVNDKLRAEVNQKEREIQFHKSETDALKEFCHGQVLKSKELHEDLSATTQGEAIFTLIKEEFQKRSIPWENCLSFGSDNANVMVGKEKGVFGFLKKENSNIYLAGCSLHLVHIAAEKAADVLPVAVDEILIDIFHYLRKSSKRQHNLSAFQELHGLDQQKMLKHVCTRWLSIDRCLDRLLTNWMALKDFFRRERDELQKGCSSSSSEKSSAQKKVEKILNFLRSPSSKLYCLFLQYTHKAFAEFLTSMQAEEPKIHILRRSLVSLIRKIQVRFVKPCATSGKEVLSVEYKLSYNQKPGKELLIGDGARDFIRNKESNGLKDSRIEEFYQNAKKYFIAAVDYMKTKLPHGDVVLAKAEVAAVQLRSSKQLSDLEFFLNKYPILLPSGASRDDVLEEFTLYQSTELPADAQEMRIDDVWTEIAAMTNEMGKPLFPHLPSIMKGILTIPHSSAHCERVFSCVRKNRTDQRASLENDTLEALLVVKSQPGSVIDEGRVHSMKSLKEMKGAYYRHIKGKGEVECASEKDK